MGKKPDIAPEKLTDLQQIMNVGPATAEVMRRIGIEIPSDLHGQDPYEMYERLCELTGIRYDPCLLDVFISAVETMRGKPAKPWWKYTALRKKEVVKRKHRANVDGEEELGRRAFIRNGALILVAIKTLQIEKLAVGEQPGEPAVTFGVMTDLHYADKPPGGTRHYRQTPAKLANAAQELSKHTPDFVAELGDFIDAADSVEVEKEYLRTIHRQFDALPGKNHYVLGNHCVYSLTKHEFLNIVGQPKSYYSFDTGGFHFVVLDACFRSDGEPYSRKNFEWTDPNIPSSELERLQADLRKTDRPTILFIHQRLDAGGHYGVKNAPEVRTILERSEKVLAVFQGHNHKNDHREIAGVHACTLSAMVEGAGLENNAFATVDVYRDGTIRVAGFVKQQSHRFS